MQYFISLLKLEFVSVANSAENKLIRKYCTSNICLPTRQSPPLTK